MNKDMNLKVNFEEIFDDKINLPERIVNEIAENTARHIEANYIPKSVIQDKIEELESIMQKINNKPRQVGDKDLDKDAFDYIKSQYKKEALQELL